MPITAGTYNVGPSETLTDWNAVKAQIDGQTLTGDVTFIQTGNIAHTAAVSFTSVILGSRTLKFTMSVPLLGDPTIGYKTTFTNSSGANQCLAFASCSRTTGRVWFDNFYMSCSGANASNPLNNNGGGMSFLVSNSLFRYSGTNTPNNIFSQGGSGGSFWALFNVKMWRTTSGQITPAVISVSNGITISFENIITFGLVRSQWSLGNLTSPQGVIKNCIAASASATGSNFAFSGLSIPVTYCAANDSSPTGTGSIPNITNAEFISVSESSPNFLNLATTSILKVAGTATTIAENIIGIRGNDRPGFDNSTSIGPDEADPIGSISISGSGYRIRPWPFCTITPAITWIQDSAGYWNGSDRGASQDIYEATAIFQGLEATLNALEQILEASRESVALSNFSVELFAPNVDHTGTINAAVVSMKRTHVQYGTPSHVYELQVVFRAIAPTILSTTPSLSTLRPQEGQEAGHSYESPKSFSYSQVAVYGDRRSDIGVFESEFSQKTSNAKAILAYLLVTARANAVSFPSISISYPWGRTRGSATNCKILGFSISRSNLNRWSIKIKFGEST